MGMTMIEKILANHSNQKEVKVGDIVIVDYDYYVLCDRVFGITGADGMKDLPLKIADPDKMVIMPDHAILAPSIHYAECQANYRRFCKKFGIKNLFDVGRHGIMHPLLAEEGFALPGNLIANADSHTCAMGAFNCGGRGLGMPELKYTFCVGGDSWFKVCPTVLIEFTGKLPEYCNGKDVFLYIAGKYGEFTNKNIEFGGPGVANLTIFDRLTIASMCAEISAEFATFPCDEVTLEYFKGRARTDFTPVAPDPDAVYERKITINLDEMVPYVCLPDFIPGNCKPVSEVEDQKIHIDQGFVGSCTNGSIQDIAEAANIMKGHKVAEGSRLIVSPATSNTYLEAAKLGYLEILSEAGAVITNASCGVCCGGHMGLMASGERCIACSSRNFKGRMGPPDSEILLASPATVAASAIAGYIVDPRKYM